MANEVWFAIEKDANGFPKTRDWEGLHCEVVSKKENFFKVKNVPFYLKDISYEDVIKAKLSPAGYLEFDCVIKRSGWSVYRLLLKNPSVLKTIVELSKAMGLQVEQDESLMALAVPPSADSDAVIDFILSGKKRGDWGAQDGFIFE